MLGPARPLPRLAVIAILLSLGCSGGESGPTEPAPNPVERATLTLNSAAALGRVGVDGLPAPSAKIEVGDYVAVFSADGAIDITIILDHDEEGWHFLAPLHSLTPLEGGDFSVVLTHGDARSAAQTLSVGTLPKAPGAYAAMVAKLTEWIELVANAAGTNIAELKEMDPAAVDPGLLLVKLAQSYLDANEDEHDLTDLALNSGSFLSADEVDLMDRFFGFIEFTTFLQLLIDEFNPGAPPAAMVAKRSAKGCINPGLEINGAGELSVRMRDSAITEFATDPNGEPARILTFGADVMGILGSGRGLVGAVATLGGITFASVDAAMGYLAGTRPSRFTSITCDMDPKEYNEDFEFSGAYSNVVVTAVSSGFRADRAIANATLSVLGGAVGATNRLQIASNDYLDYPAGAVAGVAAGLIFDETEFIEFCPQPWTIDISDAPFQTAGVENRRFEVDVLTRLVTPIDIGPDVLTIAAQPSLFGGRTISKQIPLEVKAIEVDITPALVRLENPGFPIDLDGTIANADDPRLAWLPERGNWTDALPDTTQGDASRTLSTPSNPDFYPFEVRVESVSRGGLRESGTPARFAVARIELGGAPLEIAPGYGCLPNGTTQQFSIVGESVEVNWEVSEGAGSIDANGLYTAPANGDGSVTIRAVAVDDPSRVGYVTIDVASCDCWIKIEVSGDSSWSHEDTQIAYWVIETPYGPTYHFNIFTEPDAQGRQISAGIGNVSSEYFPVPGDVGPFPAGVTYSNSEMSWFNDGNMFVTFDEFTHSYMRGTFAGILVNWDEFGEVVTSVDVRVDFRALRYGLNDPYPCE